MTTTWRPDDDEPEFAKPGLWGTALAVLRAAVIFVVVFGGLALLLALRLIERPLFGMDRPWTPSITRVVCRITLALMGLRYRVEGQAAQAPAAIVANHTSWLDIFVLNATQKVYFVSKDEVAGWPGIGWLARATGTVFIRRDRREAAAQTRLLAERLRHGHRLLIFPEGTSTDGCRVLPFKPTLFGAFTGAEVEGLKIQPISVIYEAPAGQDARFFGWWGEQSFGESLMRVLSASPQGRVTVVQHDPVNVAETPSRKALSRACEDTVRGTLDQRLLRG